MIQGNITHMKKKKKRHLKLSKAIVIDTFSLNRTGHLTLLAIEDGKMLPLLQDIGQHSWLARLSIKT